MKDKQAQNLRTLKEKVINGIVLLLVREGILKFIAIFGQLILVRLLLPEYFGIFAFITFLVTLSEFFGDLGLTQAIIRSKKSEDDTVLSTVFYIKQALGIFAYGILVIIIFITLRLFPFLTPQHARLALLLGIILVIKPYKSVLIAIMDKNLNYKAISIVDSAGMLTYYLVAIVLALNHFYIINFVIGLIVKEIVELLISIHITSWVPRAAFSFHKVAEMIKFGVFIQFGGIIMLVHNSIIPILGGALFGVKVVGYLNWSLNIASLPNTVIDSYGRAALAGISKIQEKLQLVSISVNKSTSMLNNLLFLFVAFVLSFGKDIIYFVITDKWLPALPALLIFTCASIFTGSMVSIGHALIAMGKSKDLSLISLFTVCIEFLLALISFRFIGFTGIAVSFLVSTFIQFICYIFLAKRERIDIELARSFFLKLFILSLVITAFLILNTALSFTIYNFVIKAILLPIVYILLLVVFAKQETIEMFELLKAQIRK
jgi:PST family polysaccharide transporter